MKQFHLSEFVSGLQALQQHRVDDMDTLFGLLHPPLRRAPETVAAAGAGSTASTHSGSTSQHSSDDQKPTDVVGLGLGLDLQVAGSGSTGSSDQEDWGLDAVCQWSSVSRIC
jgi:transcription factor MYB, plant